MSRYDDGRLHLEWARQADGRGDFRYARAEYLKSVESFRQAKQDGTRGEVEWIDATKEYEGFVKRDPFFIDLLARLLPLIQQHPGMLQSDVPKHHPDLPREDISYALYFAAQFGKITRTKKGRSYELTAN